jgi:carbon storage regulator
MLILTRKANESITIGHNITVSVVEIKGTQIKLGIEAPKHIPVNRTEIHETIINENIRASQPPDDLGDFLKGFPWNEKKR